MQKNTYSVEESKYIKVGLYTIAIIAIIMTIVYLPQKNKHSLDEKQSYDLYARFNRTDGLLVGDPVRMTGITIGKVTNSKLDEDFKAVLTLTIKEGINIPDDSSASIVSSSMIGGSKYIEVDPGGMDSYLTEKSEFGYTQDAMILEELLQRIIDLGKANRQKGNNNE